MTSRTHIAAIAFLAAALTTPVARAQSNVEADLARGVALRRQGQDQAALEVFQAAWRSSRAPRALAQVALAEHALGRWVEAEEHLVEALGGTSDAWVRNRLSVLQSALTEIRQHVGRLDISGRPVGAEVVVEGRVVGTLPLERPLRVHTGSVTFTVRREGYVPATRTVQVAPSYPLRETVVLAPVPPAQVIAPTPALVVTPMAARPERRTRTSPVRYAGYALIATGAAGLVVSGVFLGMNLSLAGDAEAATATSAEPFGAWARFSAGASTASAQTPDAQCALARQQTGADAMQVRDLCASASTTATVALVAGIAGGAVALTGVILAAVGRDREESATAGWSVSPWFARRAGGASLQRAW